jgi:succinoglycan biosynthesis protein ExoM
MRQASDIAVLIPTLRRPESLERAIRSVLNQVGVEGRLKEIIVIDNDPEASAKSLVAALAQTSAWPLHWCHAPVPGVATARNRGLAETDAPLIAFLDDDESASPRWLASLIQAQETLGTDVVFGPIQGQVPVGTRWEPYLSTFFGRQGPETTQEIDSPYGCGNSLMIRETALPGPAPFNTSADQSGGEDDALFATLSMRGGRFGWAADAWVDEYAPPHRARLSFALSRAFAYGQGPSQTAAASKAWLQVVRWMLIGAAQAGVYGLIALGMILIRHPRQIHILDKAVRGLGKLFWMPIFESHFYGAQELRRLEKSA